MMIFSKHLYRFITFFIFGTAIANAQERPIGAWRSHLPYNSAIGVATDGNTLYTICKQGFFTLEGTNPGGVPVPYSKVGGMSDMGMQCVAYDAATSTTILAYTDGNIDLFNEGQSTFYNVPDLKVKTVSGDKTINQVYTENGTAYICTAAGILVLDLGTHTIKENYQFIVNNRIVPVYSFIGNRGYFYAVTSQGVYKANKNNPQLQNFQVWELIDNTVYNGIASVNDSLFLSQPKAVFALINDVPHTVFAITDTFNFVHHIDPSMKGLMISEFAPQLFRGTLLIMDNTYNLIDSFTAGLGDLRQATQLLDSTIWVADAYSGLLKVHPGAADVHIPPGPSNEGCYDIYALNNDIWVAHGGYTEDLYTTPSLGGVSNFTKNNWKHYLRFEYPPFNDIDNFVALARDETKGTTYMGSYLSGLFILNQDGTNTLVGDNSIFDSSFANGAHAHQVVGLGLDQSNNLWVTLAFAQHQLYELTAADSVWHKFYYPARVNGGPLVVDDNGQVWSVALRANANDIGGVLVYNPNHDSANNGFYLLQSGVGSGNLPSNNVHCIAKDQNNNIWIGTDNGIGIASGCSAPVPCDAQIPIVQYDQFAGYLFSGNNVRTIAVDGANRKWVGTSDGVWLISPNADKIINRFTVDNSPLPSNEVRKITVDKGTGDVYFGTDAGLISYRGMATDATTSTHGVEIFPNPVNHDYEGPIAIKGLSANADIRITDINGQLVYKGTAYGGQAVWNGKDYKGRKPQSGVYIVYASSSDGAHTYSGKIVFMQ
jgi:hypothetical protein